MFGRDTFLGGLAFLVAFRTKVFLITEWPVPRSSRKSMFGVSEKCWEGRQEDNAVAEVGFCFADVDALNKPSGVC